MRAIAAVVLCVVVAAGLCGMAVAGSLDSPDVPSAGSGLYTLNQVFDYLNAGTAPMAWSYFQGPSSGPTVGTMKNTKQIVEAVQTPFAQCDATAADVKTGTKFFSTQSGSWGVQTGTIPSRTVSGGTVSQPAGYYAAFDLATIDTDLAASNIMSGVAIYGVGGTAVEATGNAEAGEVLAGKTFSKAGQAGVTGTMPNQGAVAVTPATGNQAIAAGYHNGSGYVAGDADLVSGNIRSGVNLFGVSGDSNVVDTSPGDAGAGDIKSGKKAFVDGSQVTGTIPARTVANTTVSQDAGYYDAFNLSTVDTDLTASNIKSGANIYGVAGTLNPAPECKTASDPFSGSCSTGVFYKDPKLRYNSTWYPIHAWYADQWCKCVGWSGGASYLLSSSLGHSAYLNAGSCAVQWWSTNTNFVSVVQCW